MNKTILLAIYLLSPWTCIGQATLDQITREPGEYTVGYANYLAIDSTRTYKRTFDWNGKDIPRPIPISIWYPAEETPANQVPIKVLDYLEVLKNEEEWEMLPNDQILNWFSYQNTPENRSHLVAETNSMLDSKPITGQFPVVVYAPGYQRSSVENFALFEYLASHGYVIISSPSRGTNTRQLEGGTKKDMETQARDIEFLIKEAGKLNYTDLAKIASMGFSFGGLSSVLAQMSNGNIKCLVSLDGSIKYQYETLKKSAFYSIEKVTVPFIHFSQKDIPQSVLLEDKIDAKLNYEFEFFDDLIYSTAYSLKFHHLSHSHFSSLGILFENRDQRQDKSDPEIVESYNIMSLYILNFLDAFLKDDTTAGAFINSEPEENGIATGLITKINKSARSGTFTFEDYHLLAREGQYEALKALYDSLQQVYPSFLAEEWKLNNLGLQLTFDAKSAASGIKVLLFATELYPNSANLFDSLATAYLFGGDKKQAAENFKRSLELNPDNQHAIDRLTELKD